MFFDLPEKVQAMKAFLRLNPFRTGRCFSTEAIERRSTEFARLNPFRTGRCFSTYYHYLWEIYIMCLNPFRTGRCFSTIERYLRLHCPGVSIPFEQGDVFRLQRYAGGRNHAAFQTHFPIFLEG